MRRNQIFRAALAAKTVNRDATVVPGLMVVMESLGIADVLAPKVIRAQLVVVVKTDATDAKAP